MIGDFNQDEVNEREDSHVGARSRRALATLCCRARLDVEEGQWLVRASGQETHVRLGYASFGEYIERLFGYSPRWTAEKLRVAEALRGSLSSRARWLRARFRGRSRASSRALLRRDRGGMAFGGSGPNGARRGAHGVGASDGKPSERPHRSGCTKACAEVRRDWRDTRDFSRGSREAQTRIHRLARRRCGTPLDVAARARWPSGRRAIELSGGGHGVRELWERARAGVRRARPRRPRGRRDGGM